MTTLELLDAVEAGIATLRLQGAPGQPTARAVAGTAAGLHAALRAAGLSEVEFAKAACVPLHEVEAWTAGLSPVPEWVGAAIRLVALLTPSARRKLLFSRAGAHAQPANFHPFAQIEDL